jgi:bacillithiol system protein YtxJ
MSWIALENEDQLAEIKQRSFHNPQLIFKHSTRCSISSMAKHRLDNSIKPHHVDYYYLDLLKYRSLSTRIADEFSVSHQSPQVLLIKDGECIYDESHSSIHMNEIEKMLK